MPFEYQNQEPERQTESVTLLALPAPSESDNAQKLDLSQEQINTLKFDTLGPMVVNSDGTSSRITNWENMVPLERERTMRVLNTRNRLRLDGQQKKSVDASGEVVTLATSGT